MNENCEEESFEFRKMINNNVNYLYTQMLNGERIKKNEVVYVFDEVGCGKTVSAIIAMASVIVQKQKKEPNKGYKILVLTPKSVCRQFEDEIKDKLNVELDNIINIAFESTSDLPTKIENIKQSDSKIVVSNPHKSHKLANIEWDLVIIDEAHDIVCNNKKQTEIYMGEKIEESYNNYQKKLNYNQDRIKEFNQFIENHKNANSYISSFIKYLAIEEYNDEIHKQDSDNYYKNYIPIQDHRQSETKMFVNICELNSKKVMFLTATPYKNNLDIDFLNYALVATKIVSNNLFNFNYLPHMDWIQKFYTGNINNDSLQEMEQSNTSKMFKEIAQAIPLDGQADNIKGKERIVEIWEEDNSRANVLETKVRAVLQSEQKNRIIIFVSNSREGKYIFDKIFPNAIDDYDIVEDGNHCYVDHKTNIKCEFIMNKFGNSWNLKKYSKEQNKNEKNEDIPDILIVTWQVAQVGVNLPTFNYVVNYSIPAIAGYLEQRYGRIDRLNSINNPLYNIYYLDKHPRSAIYKSNLIEALYNYKQGIMDIPHNMPVKNLLLCNGLKIGEIDCRYLYKSLAFYLWCYIKESDDEKKDGEKEEKKNYIESVKKKYNIEIYGDKIKIENYDFPCTESQIDDEINENSMIEYDSNKKRINELSRYISKIEEMNNMSRKLARANLGTAGSIIFWDSSKKSAVINCKEIVEKIMKVKKDRINY